MPVQKLQTTDGFVVRDFADAPSSGIVRRGRKILQRSATDLARSATYAFASHGIERGGASAGLNAEGDDEGPALLALTAELHDQLADRRLELLPAKGIDHEELQAAIDASDGNSGNGNTDDDSGRDTDESAPAAGDDPGVEALVSGVLAATAWALGGPLDGRSIFVEGDPSDPTHRALVDAVTAAGASVVEPNVAEGKPWTVWATVADAILVGSKPGAMNHQGAELLNVGAVIPWSPIPITTKALAVMLSRDIVYVPDFLAASGPLVARHLPGADGDSGQQITDQVTDRLEALSSDDEPLFISACHQAESFLTTWQDELPFGRPLAG